MKEKGSEEEKGEEGAANLEAGEEEGEAEKEHSPRISKEDQKKQRKLLAMEIKDAEILEGEPALVEAVQERVKFLSYYCKQRIFSLLVFVVLFPTDQSYEFFRCLKTKDDIKAILRVEGIEKKGPKKNTIDSVLPKLLNVLEQKFELDLTAPDWHRTICAVKTRERIERALDIDGDMPEMLCLDVIFQLWNSPKNKKGSTGGTKGEKKANFISDHNAQLLLPASPLNKTHLKEGSLLQDDFRYDPDGVYQGYFYIVRWDLPFVSECLLKKLVSQKTAKKFCLYAMKIILPLLPHMAPLSTKKGKLDRVEVTVISPNIAVNCTPLFEFLKPLQSGCCSEPLVRNLPEGLTA